MKETAYDFFLCLLFFVGLLATAAGLVCGSVWFVLIGMGLLILFRELLLTP